MWRTSWLSREVIVLPVFMVLVTVYGWMHWLGRPGTLTLGLLAAAVCVLLFVCTGMIYACIKFLQEWATPLTLVNFTLLGCASGVMLATALAAVRGEPNVSVLGQWAMLLTLAGMATRIDFASAQCRAETQINTAKRDRHPSSESRAEGAGFHGRFLQYP